MKKPMATMNDDLGSIEDFNKRHGSVLFSIFVLCILAAGWMENKEQVAAEKLRQDGCHEEREKWSDATFKLCGDEISDEEDAE